MKSCFPLIDYLPLAKMKHTSLMATTNQLCGVDTVLSSKDKVSHSSTQQCLWLDLNQGSLDLMGESFQD